MRPGLAAYGLAATLAALGAHAQSTSGALPSATPSPSACCLIAAGTPVEIELTQKLSSKTSTEGDRFVIRLAQDLAVDGVVVMAAGAVGEGEVIDAAPGGIAGRPGKLVLVARSLSVGSLRIPLRSFKLAGMGRDDSKAAMALTMTPYVGILAYGMKGGNIEFPAGTRALAKVAAATTAPGLTAAAAASTPLAKEKTQ